MNGTLILNIILILMIVVSLWNLIPGIFHRMQNITPDLIPVAQEGVQFVGHSTILIQMNGKRILTDPILTTNITILRRFVSLGIQEDLLKTIDIVLISHAHTDHFHIRSLKKLNKETKIIVPVGLKKRLIAHGFGNVEELAIGTQKHIEGIEISGVHAQHATSPNAMGFILKSNWTVYFSGDTALSETNMKEIGTKYDIDLAFLPIGCYRGSLLSLIPISFGRIHMSPEQLERANEFIHPKTIVPIHWGTFLIGSEPIHEAMSRLQQIMLKKPLPVKIITHGQWQNREDLQKWN